MTYQEIKNQLRAFQAQDYAIPALNSKKEVLEAALNEILALEAAKVEAAEGSISAPAIEEVIASEETTPTNHVPQELDFTPAQSIWHPFRLELTPDIRFVGEVMLYAIALIKFLAIKATPYVTKGLNIALAGAVKSAVIFQVWILPKLVLGAYLVGIWGLTIALKLIRRWRVAIA
jgi:hypothetical protein